MNIPSCCALGLVVWAVWGVANMLLYIFPLEPVFITGAGYLAAVFLFPIPAIGLWFYSGARSSVMTKSGTSLLEIIFVSLGAMIGFLLLMIALNRLIPIFKSNDVLQNFEYIGIFILFLWVSYSTILLSFFINHQRKELQSILAHRQKLEQTIREAELEVLHSQLNPHFLFNALNSLAALSLSQPRKAHEMIIELSEYLRTGLLRSSRGFTALGNELDSCRMYLNIEKMRFGDRLVTLFEIDEKALQWEVPQTIFQPLHENAIKYAVSENPEITIIHTRAQIIDEMLWIYISNPIPPAIPEKKGKGLGISNIRERLKLIYLRDDLLDIHRDTDHFTVIIRFPRQHPSF